MHQSRPTLSIQTINISRLYDCTKAATVAVCVLVLDLICLTHLLFFLLFLFCSSRILFYFWVNPHRPARGRHLPFASPHSHLRPALICWLYNSEGKVWSVKGSRSKLNWTYRHGPLSSLWERQEVETKNCQQSLMNGEGTGNKAAGFDSTAMSRVERRWLLIDRRSIPKKLFFSPPNRNRRKPHKRERKAARQNNRFIGNFWRCIRASGTDQELSDRQTNQPHKKKKYCQNCWKWNFQRSRKLSKDAVSWRRCMLCQPSRNKK